MKKNTIQVKAFLNKSNGITQSPSIILDNLGIISKPPKPYLYITIFILWSVVLFCVGPFYFDQLGATDSFASLSTFLVTVVVWFYGACHIGYWVFVLIHKYFSKKPERELAQLTSLEQPSVAILYKTCDDFLEASLRSCLNQEYSNYTIYILDTSTQAEVIKKIDKFVENIPRKIHVIRNWNGNILETENLNNIINEYISESYFAITTANEILPNRFLPKLVNIIGADDACGFVQANRRVKFRKRLLLLKSLLGIIDIQNTYFQPLRNDYGFVVFRGQGGVVRTQCWQEIGGFPITAKEHIGFSVRIRERKYRGRFVEDVVCFEYLNKNVNFFGIRRKNWLPKPLQSIRTKLLRFFRAKHMTWTEKLDMIFQYINGRTMMLFLIFIFMINVLLFFFGGIE